MELLNDFRTSVERALNEIDKNWRDYDGLIICGTHSPHDVEVMIDKIKDARISGRPYLGICFGYQMAAIEYARNVLGIKDATSEEFGKGTFVVKKLPEINIGWKDGESWWNNYEVKIKVNFPDNFICVQYHPEYQSSKMKPHSILLKFINNCKNYEKIKISMQMEPNLRRVGIHPSENMGNR